MSDKNSKIRFPAFATREVRWLHEQYDFCFGKMKQKGYTDAEAVRLVWNILDETDWLNYGKGLTIEQRADMVITKEEADAREESVMLKSLKRLHAVFVNPYYNVFVDTDSEKAVARALINIGISPKDVSSMAIERTPDEPISFIIEGYYCPEVGRKLSEMLQCLVLTEDSWSNDGTDIFKNGQVAEPGTDFIGYAKAWGGEEDYFDTEFYVKRPDGTIFANGGSGVVHFDKIKQYLCKLGFDFAGFCEKYGYKILSAKGIIGHTA